MKCRSEPHVVDMVTRRMTSCGLTISGSGTVSTRRSLTPFQHRARMPNLLMIASACRGIMLERWDFARLDQALEPAQRLLGCHFRQHRQRARRSTTERAARGVETDVQLHLGAAVTRGGAKLDASFVPDRACRGACPSHQ